ncbi:YihY/virulence factor BrkB family protein [Leptolyngbya sp. NM2-A1]
MIQRSLQQRLPGLAAEMAYSLILGLFPGILTVLSAVGLVAPLQLTLQNLVRQLQDVVPSEAMVLIEDFANDIATRRDTGLFSISFIIAFWATSGALSAAMVALDQIHEIPQSRVRPYWRSRFLSFLLTIGALLLVTLAVYLVFVSNLLLRRVVGYSGPFDAWILWAAELSSLPVVLVVMSLTFGFIYRFGPSHWNPGQPIMPGAMIAAGLWAMLSNLFRLYVESFGNYNRAYGAIGAVIVLLLWLYLSSLALLLGDQLNVVVGEAMMKKRAGEPSKESKTPLKR